MIDRINISGCASYNASAQQMDGLRTVNFVYGPNGAGKTTISRIIADEAAHPTCAIFWEGGTKLEPLVYNRDFVERNFNQATGLKGIFTLGEKDIATLNQIAALNGEADTLLSKIEKLNFSLAGADGTGGKKGELAKVELDFKSECWELKKKYDPKLQGALTGFRNDAQKFKDKLLAESLKVPAQIPTLAELEKRALSVFGPTPATESRLPEITSGAFLKWEADPILGKRVIGKTDVDIAAMIQKLGNSDWVKQGIEYFENAEGHCPFCQQSAPPSLAASLSEYFDEMFARDTESIASLLEGYKLEGEQLQQALQSIIVTASKFLDVEKLKQTKAIFDSRFQLNVQRIDGKRKEPSQIVKLEPLQEVITQATTLIEQANHQVDQHNALVANLAKERQTLTAQVWAFLSGPEIQAKLTTYQQAKSNGEKAIKALESQIAAAETERANKQSEIRKLERNSTSIQPTVDDINKLLNSFGFRNFSLATVPGNTLYQIHRPDGSDAKKTLSEGEQSFISFLYFYHLLKGSESSSGMTQDRVVVFDDPVSSLDSDVLFIVGSLIRHVMENARSGLGHIKQVFVMTHNIYFHKEVAFNPKRTSGVLKDETFWTISKSNNHSTLRKHDSNPIKTSYELMWEEVRSGNLKSQTLQNTLRRIIENYFYVLGNFDKDQICNLFDGYERIICNALFSWVNEGSHSIPDDLYLVRDEKAMETFLIVFHRVFVKTNQESHYKMMMGDAYKELPESMAAPVRAGG